MNIRPKYVSAQEFDRIPASDTATRNHKYQCRTGQWIYTTESGESEVLEIAMPLKAWEKPGYTHRTQSPQLNKMLGRKRRKLKVGKR